MTKPTIITRDEWGARIPQKPLTAMSAVEGCIVHHSATDTPMSEVTGIMQMRRMQRYHQDEKGWHDIGYNLVIDGAGNAYEGRGMVGERFARGAHTKGKNATHVGICLLGDFERSDPTPEQLDELARWCRWLMQQHGFSPTKITGHRDHAATLCPGEKLHQRLNALRLRVMVEPDDLKPMQPLPPIAIPVDLPEAHRKALERFTPAQISAMRVLASRLRDEITKPHSTLWDMAKESDEFEVAMEAGKVALGAALSIGFELFLGVLIRASGLETDDGGTG